MYRKKRILPGRTFSAVLMITLTLASCTKETVSNPEPKSNATFIPAKNKKFLYTIKSDGSGSGTATQWITGERDSAGIKVFNLHTVIESANTTMPLDNKMFAIKGKTYNEIAVPEMWQQIIKVLEAMPNTTVSKAELFGFPAYQTMENALKDGSRISLDGPLLQGQRIDYVTNGTACSMTQELLYMSGLAKVEQITVPAGTFTCNKFSYEVDMKITTKHGEGEETGNGNEKITVWMAHGIGIVKQESKATLVTIVPLPTGEIKKMETNSASTTTLESIR